MGTILHIYEIDKETTDEFVEKNFEQRFLHMHLDKHKKTILFRALSFEGKKLDTITDEKEIKDIMEKIKEEIPEEERGELGKFLSFENK
jgi:hypothetical protein